MLDLIGFPDVFSGLPPLPADPVPQPTRGLAARAARTARASMVLISGPACDRILQGTGFVVEDDLVLTNAHVIAGSSPRVEWDGRTFDAVPVLFDETSTRRSCGSTAWTRRRSRCWPQEVARGTGGAVLGYPHGRYTELGAAARRALDAVGRDIYSEDQVRRRIYELQVTVKPGNSGGPFVLPGGKVAGLIFGASVTNEDLGYALTSPELIPLVDRAAVRADAVGHGPLRRAERSVLDDDLDTLRSHAWSDRTPAVGEVADRVALALEGEQRRPAPERQAGTCRR